MEILEWADQNNLKLLYDIFMIGALEAFRAVARKYKIPDHILKSERIKYGYIPETIEECKQYSQSEASIVQTKGS